MTTIKTNNLGVAAIEDLVLPVDPVRNERIYFKLSAIDKNNLKGEYTQGTHLITDKPDIRIDTDKFFYKTNEPIRAIIRSTSKNPIVVVNIQNHEKVILSKFIQIDNGTASIVFPYQREFTGIIDVTAYTPFAENQSRFGYTVDTQSTIYPSTENINLKLSLNKTEFKPGDEVITNIQVRNNNGSDRESVIGAVVYDKAIDERARSDRDINSQLHDMGFNINDDTNEVKVNGIGIKELLRATSNNIYPNELETIAKILLRNPGVRTSDSHLIFRSKESDYVVEKAFRHILDAPLIPYIEIINKEYNDRNIYPENEEELRRLIQINDLDLNDAIDPWGNKYRIEFQNKHDRYKTIEWINLGPDEKFKTDDDIIAISKQFPYFENIGKIIDRVFFKHHLRTGSFIRDISTLRDECLKENLDLNTLTDPWGTLYKFQFGVDKKDFTITALSSGPDKLDEGETLEVGIVLWVSKLNYFEELRTKINESIHKYAESKSHFPTNETEIHEALNLKGIDFKKIVDPWNQPYTLNYQIVSQKRYKATFHDIAIYNEKSKRTLINATIKHSIGELTISSLGEDGLLETEDDIILASFKYTTENKIVNEKENQLGMPVLTPGAFGEISGTVMDSTEAVIANASVIAIEANRDRSYRVQTNNDGRYRLDNIPVGTYKLLVESLGFRSFHVISLPVYSSTITQYDVELQVGEITETVQLSTLAPPSVSTDSSSVSSSSRERSDLPPPQSISTPRLREYFPETLLWQPEIITDRNGNAQLKFKLADNMTTWKLAVIASTKDGKLINDEKEFKAFQPFFIEHDPPKYLTQGDEISLPVIVRNYTDKDAKVSLDVKPEYWFQVLGSNKLNIDSPKEKSMTEIFNFRAISSTLGKGEAKQPITAYSQNIDDAVEKPVVVRPDGEEVILTQVTSPGSESTIELNVPSNSIDKAIKSELKIYTNPFGHILESIEGIMKRPYGCGEQTISSTYPSLLALRMFKITGDNASPTISKARSYLKSGVDRLLGYRTKEGGFGYWQDASDDPTLTAYALKFLVDAKEFIDIDEAVLDGALNRLIALQDNKGSSKDNSIQDAYIFRTLTKYIVEAKKRGPTNNTPFVSVHRDFKIEIEPDTHSQLNEQNDPYLLALGAQLLFDAGKNDRGVEALEQLQKLAIVDGQTVYWSPKSHTAFNGWGHAGTIETTAIAIQALSYKSSLYQQQINKAKLYLLKNKDQYGVWHSTQATVNVLDALLADNANSSSSNNSQSFVDIAVSGQKVSSIKLPQNNKVEMPLIVDISKYLDKRAQKIEIKASDKRAIESQLVTTWYQPWNEQSKVDNSMGLEFNVKYDKTTAEINETITVNVIAGRGTCSKSRGMLTAEIGLPPGAEVDRKSLDQIMKQRNISSYDVQPDRVVIYLSPVFEKAENLSFKFRTRYGIKAKSTPSVMYDYYNPEARVSLRPVVFTTR